MRELVMLGGPNGAGKTTAAASLLPKALGIREFVNADEIARGLSPFNPEGTAIAAGRLMIGRIRTWSRPARASLSKRPAPALATRVCCGTAGS